MLRMAVRESEPGPRSAPCGRRRDRPRAAVSLGSSGSDHRHRACSRVSLVNQNRAPCSIARACSAMYARASAGRGVVDGGGAWSPWARATLTDRCRPCSAASRSGLTTNRSHRRRFSCACRCRPVRIRPVTDPTSMGASQARVTHPATNAPVLPGRRMGSGGCLGEFSGPSRPSGSGECLLSPPACDLQAAASRTDRNARGGWSVVELQIGRGSAAPAGPSPAVVSVARRSSWPPPRGGKPG